MKITRLLACTITFILPALSHALPFKEVVVALDNHNHEIRLASNKIELTQHEMRTERNLSDPSVELEVMSPKSNAEVEMVVSQEFAFPTKYVRMKKASRTAYRRDSIEYELTRKEVISKAYAICAEIIYLNQITAIDSARYEIAKANFERLEKGLEGGKYNILEVNDSHMEMITAYSNLNDSQRQLSEYHLELNAMFEGDVKIEIKDRKYPENLKPCDGYLSTYDELMEVISELGAQNRKVAKAEMHPTLSAGYKMSRTDCTTHGFVVGSTIPLFSAKGKKELVESEVNAELTETTKRMDELKAELSAEHHKAEDYEKLLNLYDKKVFWQTPELLKKSLESGRITEIEYNQQLDSWYENNRVFLEQIKEYNKCLLKMAVYCD